MEHGKRQPALRVSDAERERVALALREHLVAGRLTLEELSERVDAAYAARTADELEAVVADLPAAEAVPVAARAGGGRPLRRVVAVLSGTNRRGRIRLGEQTTVVAVMGGAHLDLRSAELAAPEVELTCIAFMGGIDLLVPEGVDVDLSGFAFMGGNDIRTSGARHPGAPVLHIRGFTVMGGINVRERRRGQREAEA